MAEKEQEEEPRGIEPVRGPFLEERLANMEQKIDAIGKGQVVVMDIVRALGIRAKVLQQAADGKSLVIVIPAPKKAKGKKHGH